MSDILARLAILRECAIAEFDLTVIDDAMEEIVDLQDQVNLLRVALQTMIDGTIGPLVGGSDGSTYTVRTPSKDALNAASSALRITETQP